MLADALEESKSVVDASLRKLIQRGLPRTSLIGLQPLPEKGNPETYFRASMLGMGCARKEALKISLNLAEKRTVDGGLAMIFAKGHAAHHLHQEHLIPAVARPAMVGWWKLGDKLLSTGPDGNPSLWGYDEAVELLGGPPDYVEPHLVDHSSLLKGHPDLILNWSKVPDAPYGSPRGLEIVEFKTRMGFSFVWNAVDPSMGGKPLGKHVLQVQAYMMMSGIKRARIVYLRKGDHQDIEDSYAEHVIRADPAAQKEIKLMLKEWRAAIEAAYSTGAVPPRTMCTSFSGPLAKECPLRYRCFDRYSPSEPVAPLGS
jgi:hypothetical protein